MDTVPYKENGTSTKEEGREKIMEYCDSCGKAYGIVYDVPDEIWGKVTLKKGDGFLCIECADKRAQALGITLYWSANKGEYLTVEMERLKKEKEWLMVEYTMYWFRHGGYPYLETKQITKNILDHMQKALNKK